MAIALGSAGARLVLTSRSEDLLADVVYEVQATGAQAEAVPADLTKEEDVDTLARWVHQKHGAVQILINNAGMNLRKPIDQFTLEEWTRVVDTNLTSVFLMCRAFVPMMRGQGYGRIINMTSIMSHVSLPERTVYSTTKAGLLGFTKALALELAPEQITVNGISPGPFGTEMNQVIMNNEEVNRFFVSRIPVGRWGQVAEIGHLAVYLCSPEASFITGTDIVIDGGWLAQ